MVAYYRGSISGSQPNIRIPIKKFASTQGLDEITRQLQAWQIRALSTKVPSEVNKGAHDLWKEATESHQAQVDGEVGDKRENHSSSAFLREI